MIGKKNLAWVPKGTIPSTNKGGPKSYWVPKKDIFKIVGTLGRSPRKNNMGYG